MQPKKSEQTWLMREHADGLCCVLYASGYWRLCTDGKENSTDPAVVWDRAGRNWTPQWDPGHNPPAEHTHRQERQNEGNIHALHTWLLCVLYTKYVHLLCIWMKWFVRVQEGLRVALGQGSRLLESINEPVVRDPDHNMNQDELENLATVQRWEQIQDEMTVGYLPNTRLCYNSPEEK